jgi:Fe-S cluster biogenesis protein NfuA
MLERSFSVANDIREDIQRIGSLVQEIENIADPAVRATTKNLLQSLMDLHGAALEKVLETVSQLGDVGIAAIDGLGRDPLVGSLLVLYGLHPDDIEIRVERALDRVRPQLRKQSCEVRMIDIHDGHVRVRAQVASHSCGSTANAVKATIENAMYDAAPDLASLSVEGLEEKTSSGFFALDQLMAGDRSSLRRSELAGSD